MAEDTPIGNAGSESLRGDHLNGEVTQIRPGRGASPRDEGTMRLGQQLPPHLQAEMDRILAAFSALTEQQRPGALAEDGEGGSVRHSNAPPTYDPRAVLPALESGVRQAVQDRSFEDHMGEPLSQDGVTSRFESPVTPGASAEVRIPTDSQLVRSTPLTSEISVHDTPEVAAYREKVEYAIDEIKQGEQIDNVIRKTYGRIGDTITRIVPSNLRRAIYQNRATLLKIGGIVMPSAFAGTLVTVAGYGVAIGIDFASGLSITVPPLAPVVIGGVAAAGVGWLMWNFGKRVAHGQLELGAQIPVPRVRMKSHLRERILSSSAEFASELRHYANRSVGNREHPISPLAFLERKHPSDYSDLEVLYQPMQGSVGEDAAGWIARQLFRPQDARSRARASLNDFLVQELSRRPEQVAIIRSPDVQRRDFAILVPPQFCTPKSLAILQEGVGEAGILLPMINPSLVREGLEIFRARDATVR